MQEVGQGNFVIVEQVVAMKMSRNFVVIGRSSSKCSAVLLAAGGPHMTNGIYHCDRGFGP
eukprot:179654-Pyramimonas_sp.AAC.1